MPKIQSLFEELILAPWWVSLLLAGVVYLIGKVLPGITSSNLGMSVIFSVAGRIAPMLVLVLIFVAFLSFVRGFHTRSLLKRQKSVDTLNGLPWIAL